jgi:predicted TIM-barrel fold metal-dependent hydrolase
MILAKGRRYVVISTGGHAAADILDYKPYLESRYHDEFDAWAEDFRDPWGELKTRVENEFTNSELELNVGLTSAVVQANWDSTARQTVLEGQGVAAELLFPNTAPPFCPSGIFAAPGPRTKEEYEYRWAGYRAHNRWMADFCQALPGRRFRLAQIFLDHVDAAVDEARRAKVAGLKGILVPCDHVLSMQDLSRNMYEPLWAACAEVAGRCARWRRRKDHGDQLSSGLQHLMAHDI